MNRVFKKCSPSLAGFKAKSKIPGPEPYVSQLAGDGRGRFSTVSINLQKGMTPNDT